MLRFASIFAFVLTIFFGGCATRQLTPVSLTKVNLLPLALSDEFEFRKTQTYLFGNAEPRTSNDMLSFRSRKIAFGAVDSTDILARHGNYFTFSWRAHRQADITVRLEYRTEIRNDYVQAREITYLEARGSHKTEFAVIGDNYLDDGKITSWRAVLIEDGKIVALTQSFLWN